MTQNPMFKMYKDNIFIVIEPLKRVGIIEIKQVSHRDQNVEQYLKNKVEREEEYFFALLKRECFFKDRNLYKIMDKKGLVEELDAMFEKNEKDLFPVTISIYESTSIENKKPIGVQIRDIRLQKKFPLGETAEKVGITPAQLSNIESGRCKPGWDTATNLARILNTKFIIQ